MASAIDFTRLAIRYGRFLARRSAELPPNVDGIPIGTSDDGQVTRVPFRHLFIGGQSGNGKTRATTVFVRNLRRLDRQAIQAVIDPQNDFDPLLPIIAEDEGALDRVTYLSPLTTAIPLGLAVLARRSANIETWCLALAQMVSRLSTGAGRTEHLGGPRMLEVWDNLLLASVTIPDGNVGLAGDALLRPDGLAALGSVCPHPRARAWCLNTRLSEDLRASSLARIRLAFMLTPEIEASVTASTCIPLDEILRTPGALLMVALGDGWPVLRSFYLGLFGQLILTPLMARPGGFDGPPVLFVVDEVSQAAAFIGQDLVAAIQSGRTRRISVACIGQGLESIRAADGVLLQALLTNATQIVSRLSPIDAEQYARLSPLPFGIESGELARHRQAVVTDLTNSEPLSFNLFGANRHVRFRAERLDDATIAAIARRHESAIAEAKARHVLSVAGHRRLTLDDLVPPPPPRGHRSGRGGASPTGPTIRPASPGRATPPDQSTPPSAPTPGPTPRTRWG